MDGFLSHLNPRLEQRLFLVTFRLSVCTHTNRVCRECELIKEIHNSEKNNWNWLPVDGCDTDNESLII